MVGIKVKIKLESNNTVLINNEQLRAHAENVCKDCGMLFDSFEQPWLMIYLDIMKPGGWVFLNLTNGIVYTDPCEDFFPFTPARVGRQVMLEAD